jgi:hypothetical protein
VPGFIQKRRFDRDIEPYHFALSAQFPSHRQLSNPHLQNPANRLLFSQALKFGGCVQTITPEQKATL